MNQSVQLWSTPWHARLKNLADALRAESAENSAAAPRMARARVVTSPTGSWLVRARSTRKPMHLTGR